MVNTPNKTGTSKFILVLGTVAALAIIGGVLYQAQQSSEQDDLALLGVIPEQAIVEAVIEPPPVPKPRFQSLRRNHSPSQPRSQ